jgi:ketosteroid isomerase-like protein
MKTAIESKIQETNTEFYKALESQSVDRMERVWMHEAWVSCVHPGWDMILGWDGVREAWQKIFDGNQKMRVSPDDVNVRSSGDVAWVTCIENITVFQEGRFDSMQAIATNIYLNMDDDWKLIHHHASPIPVVMADTATDTVQ